MASIGTELWHKWSAYLAWGSKDQEKMCRKIPENPHHIYYLGSSANFDESQEGLSCRTEKWALLDIKRVWTLGSPASVKSTSGQRLLKEVRGLFLTHPWESWHELSLSFSSNWRFPTHHSVSTSGCILVAFGAVMSCEHDQGNIYKSRFYFY